MTPIQRTLRTARFVHIALLLMVVLDLAAAYSVRPAQNQISPIMVYAIVFVCLNDVGLAAFLRTRMVTPCEASLRSNLFDESVLKKWRQGVLTSLVMASTIPLFGLTLKLMGATWNIVGWFFLVGVLLLLAWAPRLEVSVAS